MTDTTSTPVAPGAPLGPSGWHLWAEVAEGFDLDPLEAANLAAACRQLDAVAGLEAIAEAEGMTVTTATGNRLHPAVAEARQARVALSSCSPPSTCRSAPASACRLPGSGRSALPGPGGATPPVAGTATGVRPSEVPEVATWRTPSPVASPAGADLADARSLDDLLAAEAAVLAEDRAPADWYRLAPRRQLILDRLTELAEEDLGVVDRLQAILDRPEPHHAEPLEVRAPHALARQALTRRCASSWTAPGERARLRSSATGAAKNPTPRGGPMTDPTDDRPAPPPDEADEGEVLIAQDVPMKLISETLLPNRYRTYGPSQVTSTTGRRRDFPLTRVHPFGKRRAALGGR